MKLATCHPDRKHYGKGLCIACYRDVHREEIRENHRRWMRLNPLRAKEHAEEWAKKNPEYLREKAKRLYHKDPEKYCIRSRNYRETHPEVQKNRRQRDLERTREYTRHRRALRFENGGNHTLEQWLILKLLYRGTCLCCHRTETELLSKGLKLVPDHVVPLALGGTNNIENIQPLCHGKGGCNNRKNAKCIDYRS